MSCILISSTLLLLSVILDTLHFDKDVTLSTIDKLSAIQTPPVFIQQLLIEKESGGHICPYAELFPGISVFGIINTADVKSFCPSGGEVIDGIISKLEYPLSGRGEGTIEESDLLSVPSIYFDSMVVINKLSGNISVSSSDNTVWYLRPESGGGVGLSSCSLGPQGVDGAAVIEYHFRLGNKKRLSFDLQLFAVATGGSQQARYPDICGLLENMEQSALFGSTFMLASGHGVDYHYLQYWIEACRASPLTVHLRELSDAAMGVEFVYTEEDGVTAASSTRFVAHSHARHHCSVKYVRGKNALFSSYRGATGRTNCSAGHSVDRVPIHCIQDIYAALLGLDCEERSGGTVTFASTLGFAELISRSHGRVGTGDNCLKMGLASPSSIKRARTSEYLELVEALKAFDDMENSHLHLTSLCALLARRPNDHLLSPGLVQHGAADTIIIVDGDRDIFGNFAVDGSGEEVSCYPLSDSPCAPILEGGNGDASATSSHMMLTNGFSDTHVLLFVDDVDGEIAVAERIVNSWRARSKTQMALRYSIIPVAGLGRQTGNASDYDLLVDEDVANKYAGHLPLQSVLLHVQHWVDHISSQFDLVVVLIGLESIFSFDHGGDEDGPFKGFIPQFADEVPTGKQFFSSLRYHLPLPLVFSARNGGTGCAAVGAYYAARSKNKFDADICSLNVFAFGGTALSIGKMIAKLRRSSPNVGDAQSLHEVNWSLLSQFKRITVHYIASNYAHLDVHSQFFKLGYRNTSLAYTFRTLDLKGGEYGFSSAALKFGELFSDEIDFRTDQQKYPFSLGEAVDPDMFAVAKPGTGAFVVKYPSVQMSYQQASENFADLDLTKGVSRCLYILERLLEGPSAEDLGIAVSDLSESAWIAARNESYAEAMKAAYIPVYGLMLENLGIKYAAGKLAPEQLQRAVELLNEYLRNRCTPGALVHSSGRDVVVVRALLAGLMLESGHELEGRKLFSQSLIQAPFAAVSADRKRWKRDRKRLSSRRPSSVKHTSPAAGAAVLDSSAATQLREDMRTPHTHFITVASDDNAELGHLRASAELISGVSLTAVGLGREYTNFGNKVHWVYDYLVEAMKDGPSGPATVLEDDVVVFMDAYDVLLYPTIRNIARDFHTAPTPVVFCTEHGIYPEFNSAWSYHREAPYNENYFSSRFGDAGGADDAYQAEREREDYIREHFAHEALQAKQLNSGCYIGRAKQVLEMLRLISFQADYVPDDQWLFVRFAQANPQIASMDMDRTYFRTAFRQFLDWKHVGVSVDFQMVSLPVESLNWFTVKKYNQEFVQQSWEYSASVYHENNLVILKHLKQLIVQSISQRSDFAALGAARHQIPNAVHMLHCNNKGSNSLYSSSTSVMYEIFSEYYNRTESRGKELLHANWLILDLDFEQALGALYEDFTTVRCAEPVNVPLGFESVDASSDGSYGSAVLSEKDTVLVCYYRFKLDIALRHHGMTDLYLASAAAQAPNMIPSDSYIIKTLYHIIPAFLYLLPR